VTLDAIEENLPRCGIEIGNAPQEPRLAGARGALDREAFAVCDFKRELRQCADFEVLDAQQDLISSNGMVTLAIEGTTMHRPSRRSCSALMV
jgi:hypothetical protein